MPTGYTAAIEKGISFEQFLWSCARAFGALVTMRDDPMDAPIPQRLEPSDYHAKALEKVRGDFALLNAMTPEQAAHAARDAYDRALQYHHDALARKAALRDRYSQMLAQAQAWEPPTADHYELKRFMVDQVASSIAFDCDDSYHHDAIRKLAPQTADEWRTAERERLVRDASYHERQHADEIARTNSRNAWIEALRDSLRQERTAPCSD